MKTFKQLMKIIIIIIILFTITGCLSLYEGITGENELKHEKRTKKVEAYKRKPNKRLYKDAFNERK